MADTKVPGDTDLLRDLCGEHGIDHALVVQLLEIEQDYQFQERRFGINDKLRECIMSSLETDQ